MSNQPAKMWSGRFPEPLNRTFEQWQRGFWIAITCFTIVPSSAHAQNATVTFYTHGSSLTTGVPGSKHGIFFGAIYDGPVKLTSFFEGFFEKNNRFVTLKVPAGPHEFVATNAKHPGKEVKIPIVLAPGQQYFFRAQNESSGIFVIEFEKARLDQVSCAEAHNDADGAKPLHPKHPPKALAMMRVDAETMPTCQ